MLSHPGANTEDVASVASSTAGAEDPHVPPPMPQLPTTQEAEARQLAPAPAALPTSQASQSSSATPASSQHAEQPPAAVPASPAPGPGEPPMPADTTQPVVEARISAPGALSGVPMLNHGDIVLGVPVGYAPGPHDPRSRSRGSRQKSGKKKKKKRVRDPASSGSMASSSTNASSSMAGSSISGTSMSQMSSQQSFDDDDEDVEAGGSHGGWSQREMGSEDVPVPDDSKVFHFSMPWVVCQRILYGTVIGLAVVALVIGLAVGLTVGRSDDNTSNGTPFSPYMPPPAPPGMAQTVVLSVGVELLVWRLGNARATFTAAITEAFDDRPDMAMSFVAYELPRTMGTLSGMSGPSDLVSPGFLLQFASRRPGETNSNADYVCALFQSIELREFDFDASYREQVFRWFMGYFSYTFPQKLVSRGIQPGSNGTLSFRIDKFVAQTVFTTTVDVPSNDAGDQVLKPDVVDRYLHTWSSSQIPCRGAGCSSWQLMFGICPSVGDHPHQVIGVLTVLGGLEPGTDIPIMMIYNMCGLAYFHAYEDIPYMQLELQPMPSNVEPMSDQPFLDEIRAALVACFPRAPLDDPRGGGGRSDWANETSPVFSLAMTRSMGSIFLEGIRDFGACPDLDVELAANEAELGFPLTEDCRTAKDKCGSTLRNATLAVAPRCEIDCDCGECWRCVRRSCMYEGFGVNGVCPETSKCAARTGAEA
eukprot:jgi/Mesvir1/21966/Mv08205-RA.1